MNLDELRRLLPAAPLISQCLETRHVTTIKVVTTEQIKVASLRLTDLPEETQRGLHKLRHFSGFYLPDLLFHFIEVAGVYYPNLSSFAQYPNPLDFTMEQLLSEDYHWVWFGRGRSTGIHQEGLHFSPQTSYRRPGRSSHSNLAAYRMFMDSNSTPNCPVCGEGCLRPDHWRRCSHTPRGRTVHTSENRVYQP